MKFPIKVISLAIALLLTASISSAIETIVTTIEGEVAVLDHPEEVKVLVGTVIEKVNEYSARIKIDGKIKLCYIPYDIRHEIKLTPGAFVFIRKNWRREYDTEYDIIAAEKLVKAGYSSIKGKIQLVATKEIANYIELADALKKLISRAEDVFITETKTETTIEVLEEAGVPVEDIIPPAEEVSATEEAAAAEEGAAADEGTSAEEAAAQTEGPSSPPAAPPSFPSGQGDIPPEEPEEEEEEFPEPPPLTELTVSTSSLSNGTEGTAYSATLGASGGKSPYTWSLTSGSLPGGLSLSSGGVISGTPGTGSRGTHTFTVKATDSAGNTASKELSIKIGYYKTALSDYLWIPNLSTDNLTQITKANSDTTNITLGDMPYGVAVDTNYIWVSNRNANTVMRIDKSNTANIDTIAVANGPYGVAVDDTSVWVARSGSDQVSQISKSTLSIVDTITVGDYPWGVAVDETYVWVSNQNASTVSRITKSQGAVTDTITVGTGVTPPESEPLGIAVDNTYAWVACTQHNRVTRITKSDSSTDNIAVGSGPYAVAVDNSHVWVTNFNNDSVMQINKSTLNIDNTISVGDAPYGISLDNTYVWVVNSGPGVGTKTVSRITKSTATVTDTITVAGRPEALGDATGYYYDFFWSNLAQDYVDPHITGKIYDSATGENVQGTITSIYHQNTTTAKATCASNPYSFNVDDGYYYFRVEKEGYTFPSNTIDGITAGDHGEVFYASGTKMTIDIPLDPGYPIEITKTANKRSVVAGDIVTYNIKIKNNSMWALDNIIIKDEITNGFKYVKGSTYLDSTLQTDPVISARKPTFNVGTVSGYSVLNLSYQIRVGTGIADGEYKTTAVAWNSLRNWQMSNETCCKVEVIADALFTMGTIVGKVFYDYNGNGVQDPPQISSKSKRGGLQYESGIAGIRIATEYGVVVETDEDGKYHIPAVPPGTHLLKVDPSSIKIPPPLESGSPVSFQLTSENPYLVKITEGLLAKVNFGVTQIFADESAQIAADKKFFIVALAEGIVRNLSTSGNVEMVEKDDRYDEGIRVDGKLALFLKGKIKGKYLVTASFDTDRRPARKGRSYQLSKLFTDLDPDKYYPVYGDASEINYEAADTQDELYLLVEWDKSHIKWGAFNTEIPLYNRTMQGTSIIYESVGQTKFGDPYTKLTAFYARAYQVSAHDEFLGTGGSLYYLRHIPIIEGSQKVSVELRDQLNKETITSVILEEEKDYEIDYETGRILLKKPLTSVSYNYESSIISNDILSGTRAYLVVNYEYEAASSLRREAYGIKGSQQIGSHIKVGGTYIEEENTDRYYRLMGGDSTVKLNKDTEVSGEYLRSEETQLAGSYSITGGLDFNTKTTTADNDKTGSAVIIKGKTKLFANTDIKASYTRSDAHFSATNTLGTQGASIYTGSIISRLKKNFMLGLKHTTQIVNDVSLTKDLIGNNKVHTTTALLNYKSGRWDLRLEYQHQQIHDPFIDFTYAGFRQLMNHDIIGTRIGYRFNDRFHPYIGGQGTIGGQVNNQGYVGAEIQLWDATYINIKETVGNLGNSTLLGLSSSVTPDTEIYTNIEVGNNAQQDDRYTKTTYGQRTQLSPTSSVYVEHDYSSWQENLLRGNVLGYEAELGESLALGISYERAQIEKEPTAVGRDTGSITLSYLDIDKLHLFSKIEVREDRESNTKLQWLTQNKALWYLTQDISLAGRANWSITKNRTIDDVEAQFHEMGAGLAYRPVRFDRLNLLAKYSYITNHSPESQNDFPFTTKDKKHIYAIEGAFDIFKYLQLVGKFAMRDLKEKVGPRNCTNSDTYLYIGRLNFHITRAWDIATEYRTLANRQIEDIRSGWLVEVDRELGKYIRLGVGYNFTDYDDDLANDDNYDVKGWFVRVNGKY